MDVPAALTPRQNATISQTQYGALSAWANGRFVADWDQPFTPPASIDAVPLPSRPAMLDRAALDYCLADAFHPGCEVTWPMRHLTMYSKPFRIRHRRSSSAAPSYGEKLTQQEVLGRNGPLFEQSPGDLTRWMGLPWQADTAYCRAGYDRAYDLYQPTFWPARVPNHVLTDADYAMVVDPAQPRPVRIEAFLNRTSWTSPLQSGVPPPDVTAQMEKMVRVFASMGLLEERPGVSADPEFPATMLVASYGPDVEPPVPVLLPAPHTRLAGAPPVPRIERTANFRSEEEAQIAPRHVRHSRK